MILGENKTIHDYIVELLLKEKVSDFEKIQSFLENEHKQVTIQGIYKSLRELLSEKIIVKHKKSYSINNIWKDKLTKLLSKNEYHFNLLEKETVTYSFKTISQVDIFWKHTLNEIRKEVDNFPIFDFCPHNFWILLPNIQESEEEYYSFFLENEISRFFLIGGETAHDLSFKKSTTDIYQKIHCDENTSFNRRDHITIYKDYIITIRISLRLAKEMDSVYKEINQEPLLVSKLVKMVKNQGNIKMTIEKDFEKAKKLRKRIAKDFYISRELKEKFDLF